MRRHVPLVLFLAAISTILAIAFLTHRGRVREIDQITAIGGPPPALDPTSATGYAHGMRRLIVPGRNAESYQWIIQTQQMLHAGEWRVRHADYDNAPVGRAVHAPSPFRWWLAVVALPSRTVSDNSPGLAVEHAALWAEPVLHLLAVAGTAAFVFWSMGPWAACLTALILAFGFPLAGMFQAGAPEDVGLSQVMVLAGLLLMVAGTKPADGPSRKLFALSGVVFALALWLRPSTAVPILGGICASGVVLGFCASRSPGTAGEATFSLPWRLWGVCGAVATLLAYLAEFAPRHLSWSEPGLLEVHPLYAVAWLGAAECTHRANTSFAKRGFARGWKGWLVAGGALAALAALPVGMYLAESRAFLQSETFSDRLTPLLGTITAPDFPSLIERDGLTRPTVAAFLPVLLVLFPLGHAIGCILSRRPPPSVVLLLGPALVVAWRAWHHLAWWASVELVAVAIVAAVTSRGGDTRFSVVRAVGWVAVFLPVFGPGFGLGSSSFDGSDAQELSDMDQQSLAERDLAHWLARRSVPDGAIVLAPPELTVSMIYYGGVRGLGSLYRENSAGFDAAVRLCAATSADEAEVLVRQRSLTHIIMPSWDDFLHQYARLGTTQLQSSLVALLDSWLPPRWLRPAAYRLPPVPILAGERVNVFEVTEVQDQALALCRLADFFLDMRDGSQAANLCRVLAEKFPEDIAVQTVIARGQLARGERFSFANTLNTIVLHVTEGAADELPWDRRVSLALMLASGEKLEEARDQVAWCAETATESDVRRLSLSALYGFAKLCEQFSTRLAEPSFEAIMKERLPEEPEPTR